MSRKAILIAAVFFCAGVAVSVGMRLLPAHHSAPDHGRHSSELEVSFNLLQQPLQDTEGGNATLASVMGEGERLLVNFWATWCAPCLHEMPLLQEAQQQHGVKTVGVSYEEADIINAFRARHPVRYPLYKSSFDIFYFFQQQGNRTAVMPYTVLVDKEGRVVREKVGDFKTVEEIVNFLQ